MPNNVPQGDELDSLISDLGLDGDSDNVSEDGNTPEAEDDQNEDLLDDSVADQEEDEKGIPPKGHVPKQVLIEERRRRREETEALRKEIKALKGEDPDAESTPTDTLDRYAKADLRRAYAYLSQLGADPTPDGDDSWIGLQIQSLYQEQGLTYEEAAEEVVKKNPAYFEAKKRNETTKPMTTKPRPSAQPAPKTRQDLVEEAVNSKDNRFTKAEKEVAMAEWLFGK